MKPSLSSSGLSSSSDMGESEEEPVLDCSKMWPSMDKSTERLPLLRSWSTVTVWLLLVGVVVGGVAGTACSARE